MNRRRRALADELLTQSRDHDAEQSARLDRFRNVEPETAELLGVLVRALQPRTMLELGTSNGYSTVWLADAAELVGARLVSVDVDATRSELARTNLQQAGLADAAELRVLDALEILSVSGEGEWDFVFLDAERPAYASYWPELQRTLAPWALLAVDNVLSHPAEVADFRSAVDATPGFVSAVDPVGAGLLLVVPEGGSGTHRGRGARAPRPHA